MNLIPENFDWRQYLKLNPDLNQSINEIEAKIHYIKYGIYESRIYQKKDNVSKDIKKNFYKKNKNKNSDNFDESNILYTRLFLKDSENYLKYNIDISILDSLEHFILVIDFNNGGGGTTFFINTIVSKYKNYNTFLILRYDGSKYYLNLNEEYLINIDYKLIDIKNIVNKYKHKISSIFINHLIGYPSEFIEYILNLDIYKITITHDYFNVLKNPQPTFKSICYEQKNNFININCFDKIITQNIKNKLYFSKYYNKEIDVVELPDYKYSYNKIDTHNKKTKCCIIGNITDLKGKQKIKKIVEYFNIRDKNIEFFILGYIEDASNIKSHHYNNITEFNDLLLKYKPNIIIELTLWPETYSYTLTLSMLTKLPILYLKKPNSSVVKERLEYYDKSYEFNNYNILHDLIITHSQNYFYTIYPILTYNSYWENLFVTNTEKRIFKSIHHKYDIQPYFIYFPQFHNFFENDINFYKGYTDIKNLELYNNKNLIKLEIPDKEYTGTEIYDYMMNKNLIQKQIDLIKNYGFKGFALYYYWFTNNTYTNSNMIMTKIVDKFFQKNINMYDKKIFFIWANENWTKNIALSPNNTSQQIITNDYDVDSFIKNSKNLIKYFKHNNYLKIDNKPVLIIYHTYAMINIDQFYEILNSMCINNSFDGVHLVLNSIDKTYPTYKNCYINFNYKKYDSRFYDSKESQIKLDYKKYMDDNYHCQENKIHTIVFDFNNKPRLTQPDNLKHSTLCINNTEMHKTIFSKKIIETYNRYNLNGIDKILLINAFNEWGENMVFEPTDKYKYYNINLLKLLIDK